MTAQAAWRATRRRRGAASPARRRAARDATSFRFGGRRSPSGDASRDTAAPSGGRGAPETSGAFWRTRPPEELGGSRPQAPHASFARLNPKLRRALDNETTLAGPGGPAFRYEHPGWVGEVYSRVRRFAIVEALRENGFAHCGHGGPPGGGAANGKTPHRAYRAA